MARRSRQSILKRQRELKRLEKAQLKREKREERRRKAIEGEGEGEDGYLEGEVELDEFGVEIPRSADGTEENVESAAVVADTAAERRDEPA